MLLAVLRPFSGYLARCLTSAGRTNRGNIAPQHHEARPMVSFQWVLDSELDDGHSLLRCLSAFRLADLAVARVDARG